MWVKFPDKILYIFFKKMIRGNFQRSFPEFFFFWEEFEKISTNFQKIYLGITKAVP